VVVTHPFHPLAGQRVEVVGHVRRGGTSFLRCLGGPLGTALIPVAWTDRSEPAASTRLTYEVLVEVAGVVASLRHR
jgi:hypothetical protein